jgi:hypothetical protein
MHIHIQVTWNLYFIVTENIIFKLLFRFIKQPENKIQKIKYYEHGYYSEAVASEHKTEDENQKHLPSAPKRTTMIWQETERFVPIISKITALLRPRFLAPHKRWTTYDNEKKIVNK